MKTSSAGVIERACFDKGYGVAGSAAGVLGDGSPSQRALAAIRGTRPGTGADAFSAADAADRSAWLRRPATLSDKVPQPSAVGYWTGAGGFVAEGATTNRIIVSWPFQDVLDIVAGTSIDLQAERKTVWHLLGGA